MHLTAALILRNPRCLGDTPHRTMVNYSHATTPSPRVSSLVLLPRTLTLSPDRLFRITGQARETPDSLLTSHFLYVFPTH